MKLKRFIGLVLAVATLTCVFASCELLAGDPAALVAGADAALKEAPYTMNAKLEYTSDDEGMSAIIKSFSTPTIKVGVDGDKFNAYMYLENGNQQNYVNYTYIDGFLYTEWQENGVIVTDKKEMAQADKDELIFTLGDGINISIDDFANVSAKRDRGVDVISCDRIKAQSLSTLINVLEGQLSSLDAIVNIKDAALTIKIEDGKYKSTVLTCEYHIITELDSYVVNMTYTTSYDYESGVSVTAPAF